MNNTKVPVAILVRVSTTKQETARQISELEQYAAGKGYDIIEVCQERSRETPMTMIGMGSGGPNN